MIVMRTLTCQIKDYIQPFERQLALEELKALADGLPRAVDSTVDAALQFLVKTDAPLERLRAHLAYWQTIGFETQQITAQLRAEATSVIARNGVALNELPKVVPQIVDSKLPNKRCLRYATHGLHEYRGKFFPQLVRALMNMAQVPAEGIIIDPMCGSGTTLVEAVLSGRSAYGLDMNPLSVFVADVKCRALKLNPTRLIAAFEELSASLGKSACRPDKSYYYATLQDSDREYLAKWFATSVLDELYHIESAIEKLSGAGIRDFYHLCLSNILRSVSWQKNDDLRVRKEIINVPRGEVVKRFLDEATRSTKSIVAFLAQRGSGRMGCHDVRDADARVTAQELRHLRGRVDAIITSPPYATALPYLDTDRLSLIYFRLLPRNEHRRRDAVMIGNREVTERTRSSFWEHYLQNSEVLPRDTRSLIEEIDHLNKSKNVGFRRRNLSALLSKYFFDMHVVMREQKELLRPGGTMFMVVGNNRTTAGDKQVEIRTTHHLAQIAQSIGFRVAGTLSMDMLTSRDIFRKNTLPSEQILTLQNDQ